MPGASDKNGAMPPGMVLNQEFFARDTIEVARDVLGKVLVRRVRGHERWGRIVEVEAYLGPDDQAAHSFQGHRSPRNEVMFGTAGHAYVYFTYGMHHCMNIVCGPAGTARAVLLRAGEVTRGEEEARRRRPAARSHAELARGPARLTLALGVDRSLDGVDACDPDSPLVLRAGTPPPADARRSGPRTGIGDAAERPWRFWIAGDPTVSPYRRHTPRRVRPDLS